MPRDFPTMESLTAHATAVGFRKPHEWEKEAEYREELANFVSGMDAVEAAEIRTGRGWDRMTPAELIANMGRRSFR